MAFIDSGFYPHPELAGRILAHVDASTSTIHEEDGTGFAAHDLSWHGQMTSVIAAGDGHLSGGKYRGIASESQLVLIRVSTPRGHIKEADILRGLNWLAVHHARFGVRVVNISVGGDYVSQDAKHPIYAAVRKLTRAGITVVCAAGNRGHAELLPPASAAEAITVGGVDDQNSLDSHLWRSYHHNHGLDYTGKPKPDLIAPAVWVAGPIMPETSVAREARWLGPILQAKSNKHMLRLLQKGYSDLGIAHEQVLQADSHLHSMLQARINTHKIVDAHHQHVDGTSVAAPIVAAVVAQMLEANPDLTPRQIRTILCATAQPLPDVPAQQQGAGVLRAGDAVALAAQKRGKA
jgi:serine protease AprX